MQNSFKLSPCQNNIHWPHSCPFVASDGIMAKNLCETFAIKVQLPKARCFYSIQITMKNIHNKTCSLLIDMYVKDCFKKNHLLNAVFTTPCIKSNAKWAMAWVVPSTTNHLCLVTCGLGSSRGHNLLRRFCAIYWIKKCGLIPGLCFANELISCDEGLHCNFACCLLHSKLASATCYALMHSTDNCECCNCQAQNEM